MKTHLVGKLPESTDDPTQHHARTLVAANKIDTPDAADRLEIVKEMFGPRYEIHTLNAETGSIEEIRTAITSCSM